MKKYTKILSIIISLIIISNIFTVQANADTYDKNQIRVLASLDYNIKNRLDTESDIFTSTAKTLGLKLSIAWANNNDLRQLSQIDNLVFKKPKSIIIKTDSTAPIVKDRLDKLQKNNIKVFQYDSVVNNFKPDILFTFDYEQLGRNLAFEALKNYNKGSILILMSKYKKIRSMLVVRGFLKVVASKSYANHKTPEVKIVEINDELRPVISILTPALAKNNISTILSLSSKISNYITYINQNSLSSFSNLTLIGVGYRYQNLLNAMNQNKYKHILLGYIPYKKLAYATVYTSYYYSHMNDYKVNIQKTNYDGMMIPSYLVEGIVITNNNKTILEASN